MSPDRTRGQANIQRLIYKTVPEAFTRVAELLAGRADLVVKVPPDLVEQVNRSGRARIVDVQSIQNVQIQFNHFWAPLSDRRVRQGHDARRSWQEHGLSWHKRMPPQGPC